MSLGKSQKRLRAITGAPAELAPRGIFHSALTDCIHGSHARALTNRPLSLAPRTATPSDHSNRAAGDPPRSTRILYTKIPHLSIPHIKILILPASIHARRASRAFLNKNFPRDIDFFLRLCYNSSKKQIFRYLRRQYYEGFI